MNVAEIDRELGGKRARHQLRQRHALLVVTFGNPATPLDEVAVHVADQRDRSTEAPGAEREHVAHELPAGVARRSVDDGRRLRGVARRSAHGVDRAASRA